MSSSPRFKIAISFAAIYLIWGSTYLAIRIGIETIPPFLMVGSRFLVAGLAFYAFMRFRGTPRPTRSQWKSATIIGIMLAAGGNGLVTWAEVTVPSGLTALLVAMVPMWIVLVDWLRPGGLRPSLPVVIGLLLGFAGVAFLINPSNIGGHGEIDQFGALLVILATISWAVGSVYSRQADQPESKMIGTGMQMITGGGMLLATSIVFGETTQFDFGAVTQKSWLALFYLTTVGSAGFAAYVWLLRTTAVAKVATYAYVNPVIALVLGSLLAGEIISMRTLLCSTIILLAVITIISVKKSKPKTLTTVKPEEQCQIGNEIVRLRTEMGKN